MHTATMTPPGPDTKAPARPSAQICGVETAGPRPSTGEGEAVKASFTKVITYTRCRACSIPIRPNKSTGLCRTCWLDPKNRPGDQLKQEPKKAIPAAKRIVAKSVSRSQNPGDSLLTMIEFHAWLGGLIRETGRNLTAALGPEQVAEDLTLASGKVWTRQRVWERWGARDA